MVEEIRRIIRASIGNRAKESLVVDFISATDLDDFQDKASIIEASFMYAQAKQKEEATELKSRKLERRSCQTLYFQFLKTRLCH